MTFSIKACLLAVTALVPATAFAQVAPADNNGNADIIVTARKFEEKLQNAPTSISVATSQSIDRLGLNSVADIARTTPGLVLDSSLGRSGGDRPVIRGQANINGFSGVAYFIDGIYYTGSLSDFDPYNIERMEVVLGPQSALYGRNTYSGAINLVTKQPGETWSGRVQADIRENGRYDLTGTVSGPLGGGFGVLLSGRYYDNRGEFINAYDRTRLGKQRTASASGTLKFDDGGPFRSTIRANYSSTSDGQAATFGTSTYENNCFFDRGTAYRGQGRYFCGVIQPRAVTSDWRRQFTDPNSVGTRFDVLNVAVRMDYDLTDNLTLTSLTGYNSRETNVKTDGDYTGLHFQQGVFGSILAGGTLSLINAGAATDFTNSTNGYVRDASEEVRLQYTSDRVRILAGGYYFRQTDRNNVDRALPADALDQAKAAVIVQAQQFCNATPGCLRIAATPFTTPISISAADRTVTFVTTRNLAAFGSVDFKFTDNLSLNLEGRYAEEKVTQDTQPYAVGQTPPAFATVSATFTRFTPRATLSWQATPNHLFYTTYAEGSKPGGFNGALAISAGVPTYAPETSRTFEFGTKNTFLDGKLTANLSLYHTDIAGYQLTQAITVTNPTTNQLTQTSIIRNAGNARINGFEFSLILKPVRAITVTANYAMADSRFKTGTDQVYGLLLDVADDGLVNCSTGNQFPTLAGCTSIYGSIVGKAIPRAPVHTAFVDIDLHQPLGSSGWTFFAGANVNMISTSYDQVANLASTGGSAVVDARLGFENSMLRIQGYVRNLTNETSVAQLIRYAGPDLRRNFVGGLRAPRSIGVILSAKF
jgi:iron complex outermembrane recepter protein